MILSEDELSTKVTDFYYDYDPYEFKDNYTDYNEALEDTQRTLSTKSGTRKVIYDLKEINNDLDGDDDNLIKEFFDRSSKLIRELNEYERTLEEDYEL